MLASRRTWIALLLGIVPALATLSAAWRGNGTGLWPDANPPLEWSHLAKGALEQARAMAQVPEQEGPGTAPLVLKGLLRDWLVLGPFPVEDSGKDFDKDLLEGEANVEPKAGQKLAGREWKETTVPPDDIMVFGTAELPSLDLAKVVGFQINQVAYAHTYVYSLRGGAARIVVDHSHGLKAWVNGKEVYRAPSRSMMLGYYTMISRYELNHSEPASARFDFTLKKGWNRLLLKVSTSNRKDFTDMRCNLRLVDPPDVAYESKNLLWTTPLPGRSTSTPLLVGDRLFVLAEPDEILCLDKKTGRVLWSAAVNYYEALTDDERRAKPEFAKTIDPLIARLREESDRRKRLAHRAEIQKKLLEIDEARFRISGSGHFDSHFGIVGFTMPTPVSDGKNVFVWNGLGVAACFDLDGKRRWITRVPAEEINYGSTPALVEGVLVVFLNQLFGLDATTGKVLWKQQRLNRNIAAVLGAKLGGEAVVVTQRGDVVRPSDGSLLYRPRGSNEPGDTGWAPPLILGDRVYSPKYGVTEMSIWDYAGATREKFEPRLLGTIPTPPEVSKTPQGKWIDRWTAGSPLVWDDLLYQVDMYQTLYVADLKANKTLYHRVLDLEGLTHYNAIAVAASPTLVGKHVIVQDNQGTALVLRPGREYQQVARNRIGTQLDRAWPIPAQETIGYAPPLADGSRLYLRGEANLYCVGER